MNEVDAALALADAVLLQRIIEIEGLGDEGEKLREARKTLAMHRQWLLNGLRGGWI